MSHKPIDGFAVKAIEAFGELADTLGLLSNSTMDQIVRAAKDRIERTAEDRNTIESLQRTIAKSGLGLPTDPEETLETLLKTAKDAAVARKLLDSLFVDTDPEYETLEELAKAVIEKMNRRVEVSDEAAEGISVLMGE